MALPAFWSVRKALPEARLTLLSNTNPQNPEYVLARSVLPDKGLFEDYLQYPAGNIGRRIRAVQYARLFRQIRQKRFDALIYLMTRNRTLRQIRRDEIFFRMAGIKKIIGLEYLRKNRLSFDLARPLPRVEAESEYLLNCLRKENFPVVENTSSNNYLRLTGAEKKRAERWLAKHSPAAERQKFIGVGPNSKWDSKIWAEERFGQVVEKLISERDVFPVVFGGREDREKGDRLIDFWKTGANAAGELTIREAAAALGRCRVYVGNDTGTMHLAAAVGTPCIGIFAAVDFEARWYPGGSGHRVFRRRVECEGCHTAICFNNRLCLDLIDSAEVLDAARELLNDE